MIVELPAASYKGVSVIIPTLCSKNRANLLLRAVSSCLAQQSIAVEIIIVVNGGRFDPVLYEQINNDNRLSVLYLPEGNVSKARYSGIQKSSYDYFCFLDDDDELIANTLADRVAILSKNKQTAVVVSNGYFVDGDAETLHVDDVFYRQILSSQVFSFLKKNWFSSPAGLYSKKNLSIKIFDINYSSFELTYLFFKLIEAGFVIKFDNNSVYRCYADTDDSVSKSENYMLSYPKILQMILQLDLEAYVINKLKEKYIVSLNSLSVYFLNKKQFKQSFFYHYKCILNGGFSYIFYTRKIIKAFIQSKF